MRLFLRQKVLYNLYSIFYIQDSCKFMKVKKIMNVLVIILFLLTIIYSLLWLFSFKKYPIEYGISFNQIHAESLGLDWRETYLAMLTDLQPKYIRIAAMWSQVENIKGQFDFTDVDWMMEKAEENKVKVTLVVGQKAPRWPECYVPEWAYDLSEEEYKSNLFVYAKEVVERYKDNLALELWQVENEPFIKFRFGECVRYQENLVDDEIELVRELDQSHKIIVTDSGELSTWRQAVKAGDFFGTTLYRIVRRPNGGIFTYDWLPPAFYRWKARLWGRDIKDVYISELQAEPWFTESKIGDTPIGVQEETMNTERLRSHLDYASRIGVSRAYLWGVEWWYWVKEMKSDGSFWEIIREELNG